MYDYPPENLIKLRLSHTLLELHFSHESAQARSGVARLKANCIHFSVSTSRDIYILFMLGDFERLAMQIEYVLKIRDQEPIKGGIFVPINHGIEVCPELTSGGIDSQRIHFFITLYTWDAETNDRIAFGVRDVAEVGDALNFVRDLRRLSIATP